ncbi:23S rRNA methyltransferase [Latilactobacillus fuchuensis]|uniref:23S rRNA methyltransferase n=2 Tax=Latilactobacillus fuchuensis TaxID=164393 RepID=A0A2N9DTM4_9LACO|nr:23S rRNA methyltransferase [Latilactobacillus fuchuensis]
MKTNKPYPKKRDNDFNSQRSQKNNGGKPKRRPMPEKRAPKPVETENTEEQTDFVIGKHASIETLKAPDATTKVNKIFLQDGLKADFVHDVLKLAKEKRLVIQNVPKNKLDLLSDRQNHQGIILAIAPFEYATIDDIFAKAAAKDEPPFILILDNLEDPHNLGSIMRTADAVGVHGIIIPKHRAVGLTSTVAKTSTGAIEHVPVARVTNLTQEIKKLKERGLWIFGTDMAGADYRQWDATGPIGLIIGNEGKGLSPIIKKEVDQTLTIPMVGHVQSLNASVAAGVLMYQAYNSRQPLAPKV